MIDREKQERSASKPLWVYLNDGRGSFRSDNPDHTSRLYFPLMNEAGMRCSVTPDLKGDISAGFNKYLMQPVVTEDLHRTHNSRYFWLRIKGLAPWSINGLSPVQQALKWTDTPEQSEVIARPGCFILKKRHPNIPLETEMCLTVPAGKDQVELWKITIVNKGNEVIMLTPFVALPLYGRHADNLRDHRQVTTMFQNCYRDDNGVRLKPTIVHDETGHRQNETSYFTYAYGENQQKPDRIWTRMQDFIGDGGSLNNPETVWKDLSEPEISTGQRNGVEAVAGMSFTELELKSGEKVGFVVVVGITNEDNAEDIAERYNSLDKFDLSLKDTDEYWSTLTQQVRFKTGQPDFDEWTKWLAFQLKCRQIYGNSFLPDFGYGRGGRGWRDLWQDLLSIFLVDPSGARDEIVNNLKGVRIDGSNATIIGDKPGEFKADRNNIPRTWCDHGAWPMFALNFYIQQTGDIDVLFQSINYWKDQFINRSQSIDKGWTPADGTWLKSNEGNEYRGTVLEHVLIQQISAFYNVGNHNILKLEGADWNDTLDMARNNGESVCFQSFYAGNLDILINLLKTLITSGKKEVYILQEITVLLDRTRGQRHVNYQSPEQKQELLRKYFKKIKSKVSGKQKKFDLDDLIRDLEEKRKHSGEQIRNNEWVSSEKGIEFFNGHYDDLGYPMHGLFEEGFRMDLTSQVMPVLFDIADDQKVDELYKSARNILGNTDFPGLRLCTKYPDIDMNIGRITGFVYGYKEHGSKWMQQNIMFIHGLFKKGKLEYAYQMFHDIYSISQDSQTAKTFPEIASFYEPDERGAYMYLTGSSTWIFISLLTQIFGIRGDNGNLLLNPKLSDWFFDKNGNTSIECTFQNQRIRIVYSNNKNKPASQCQILKIMADGQLLFSGKSFKVQIDKAFIRSFDKDLLYIEVSLG